MRGSWRDGGKHSILVGPNSENHMALMSDYQLSPFRSRLELDQQPGSLKVILLPLRHFASLSHRYNLHNLLKLIL